MVFGLLVSLVVLIAGGLGVIAARHVPQPDRADDEAPMRSPSARLAELVHTGLDRTAQAVDVHVERRTVEELEQETPAPVVERRATLAVMGAGLLALGVVLAIGVVLFFV